MCAPGRWGQTSDCVLSWPRAPRSVFSHCIQRAVVADGRRWGTRARHAKELLIFLSTQVATVRNILTNRVYAGQARYNYRQSVVPQYRKTAEHQLRSLKTGGVAIAQRAHGFGTKHQRLSLLSSLKKHNGNCGAMRPPPAGCTSRLQDGIYSGPSSNAASADSAWSASGT
jgi:hypothetical protein